VSNSLKVTRLKLKFLFLNTWKQLKQEQNSHLILNLRNFFWWFIDMHKQKLHRLLKCVKKFYAKNDLSIECSNKMSSYDEVTNAALFVYSLEPDPARFVHWDLHKKIFFSFKVFRLENFIGVNRDLALKLFIKIHFLYFIIGQMTNECQIKNFCHFFKKIISP